MNQYKTEPEFILEQSERTLLTAKQLNSLNLTQVLVELEGLSKELCRVHDTLGSIRDSTQVLAQSLQELE